MAANSKKIIIPIGTKFGSLEVISEAFSDESGRHTYVMCKCKCDREQRFRQSELVKGCNTQCRECYREAKTNVGPGFKHYDWTVLESCRNVRGVLGWKCECKCGNQGWLTTNSLLSDKLKCCRECHVKQKLENGNCDGTIMWKIRSHATDKGRECTVDIEYLKALLSTQNGRCALTGLPITLPKNSVEFGEFKWTASLDRIDSDLGYVEGNLQWVHKDINSLKSNWDESYFIHMCRLVAAHNPDPEPISDRLTRLHLSADCRA